MPNCLVYFKKYALMYRVRGNILRSICRSLEILIFFVVSVFGFSVLVKTTSLNTKSKTKYLQGDRVAPRELSLSEKFQPFGYNVEGLLNYFNEQHQQHSASYTLVSGTPPFPDILHHQDLLFSKFDSSRGNSTLSIAPPLHKPDNLFQQNPVLLI